MAPDGTRVPTGTLQWPLPVAGTITSQFGHRVDPITGEVSSHTAPTLPVPRVRRFSPPQMAWSLLPMALTAGAAVTGTTSKLTTVVAGNTVRPLLVHLRHHRSASTVGTSHRLCRPHRTGNREPFAFRDTHK